VHRDRVLDSAQFQPLDAAGSACVGIHRDRRHQLAVLFLEQLARVQGGIRSDAAFPGRPPQVGEGGGKPVERVAIVESGPEREGGCRPDDPILHGD
jgi:hypothetical protein